MRDPSLRKASPPQSAPRAAPRAESGSVGRGVLHLVVGPSGVGKDTLIAAARRARPDLFIPPRVITRDADAGGEDHRAVDAEDFERLEASGGFALSWRAHGLAYGVPVELAARLAAGGHALANVSRRVVEQARRLYAPVRVLSITASPEALAERLAARGRESAAEIAERLRRAEDRSPTGQDVIVIDNGGSLETGAAAFLAALAPPSRGETARGETERGDTARGETAREADP